MKKLCAMFAAIMTAATLIFLCSCAKPDPMANVSERRSEYYTAADELFEVTAVSGVREINYAADGIAGELKPFTLITLTPISTATFDVDATYTYTAEVRSADGQKSFGGALTVHPFASSWSAEFDYETTGELKVTILFGSGGVQKREYMLKNLVSPDMFGYDKAIEAARTALEPEDNCEIRVRLIKNPMGDGLCWHVAFYYADGKKCGVLLDPVYAKTLAIKKL